MKSSARNEKAQQTVEFAGLSVGGRCRVRTCDPCRVKASEGHDDAPLPSEARPQDKPKAPRAAYKLHWNYTGFLAALAFALTACGGGGSSAPAPAPAPANAPEPYVISAYGDSTQEAQGQPHSASRPGARVYNRGVGGTNTTMLLTGTDGRNFVWPVQMEREVARVIVINHGINDQGLSVEQYKANLRELVTVARKAGKLVILEEPNPAGETETPLMAAIKFDVPAFEDRRAAMKHLANHMGVYFCAQPRVPLADGIHPTAEGYATKSGRLAKCVADVL